MISSRSRVVSSRRSTRRSSRRSTLDKETMPDHWRIDNFPGPPWLAAIFRLLFVGLCLMSLGFADLDTVWEICTGDEEIWITHRNALSERITTITVVTGLLLGATAAFTTTAAPLPEIINYSLRGPYLCLLLSFGITVGALVVGATLLFVMSSCKAVWFRKTFMASRLKVCCTLITIAYPFCCTGAATLILSFGLLTAAWLSEDRFLRIGSSFTMIVPACLVFIFCWQQVGQFFQYIRERARRVESDDEESIKTEPDNMISDSPPNTAV